MGFFSPLLNSVLSTKNRRNLNPLFQELEELITMKAHPMTDFNLFLEAVSFVEKVL